MTGSEFALFPQQASTIASRVDQLYLFLVIVSFFFTVLIFTLVFYFAIRYRRRSDADRPHPIEGSLRLELVWTVIPFLITMVMFGWGASLYFGNSRPPDRPSRSTWSGASGCGSCSTRKASARSTSCTCRSAFPCA